MLLSLSHRINKAGKITPIVALRWRASSFTSTSLLLKRFHVQHTFVRFCHHTYSVTILEHATLPLQSFILNTLHFNAFALVYFVPLSCRLLIYNFIAFFVIPFWHMFNLYAFFICWGWYIIKRNWIITIKSIQKDDQISALKEHFYCDYSLILIICWPPCFFNVFLSTNVSFL